jgi:hypothetical protein
MAVMWVNPISAMPFRVGSQTAPFKLSNDWSDKIPTAPILVPGTVGRKSKLKSNETKIEVKY